MNEVQLYQHKCIGSYQNSAVKRARARLVLGWVSSWEVVMLHPTFFNYFFAVIIIIFFLRRWGKGSFRHALGGHQADLGEHIFELKIHRFDLQARRFHPYSILKAFLKSLRLILLHLIVVLCVLFYWVAHGHVWAPDPITMQASSVRRLRFIRFCVTLLTEAIIPAQMHRIPSELRH